MPQKSGQTKPRKYLRTAALSAVFAAVAVPAAVQAQSYSPDKASINREMNSAAVSFQHSYRNPSEWPLRRLDSCTHVTAEPKISSDITVIETVYDHSSLTRAELDVLGNNLAPDTMQTLGTTSGDYSYSVSVSGTTYRSGGKDCVHLSAVDIDVVFSQKIHTASELLDYSCHLDGVTKHEELHVMFNETAIQNYGAVIGDLVTDSAKKVNRRVVPQGKTPSDILSEMRELFSSTVRDTLEAAVEKADVQHKRIDTVSNYRETQKELDAKCGYSLPKFPQRKN